MITRRSINYSIARGFVALMLIQAAVVFVYANGPGNLDLTFAGSGYKYDGFGAGFDTAQDCLLQPDGKIVLIGYSLDDIALARYNPDGSLDMTFNGNGKVTTLVTLGSERANSGALQADGKIVVGGFATGTNKDFSFSGITQTARWTPLSTAMGWLSHLSWEMTRSLISRSRRTERSSRSGVRIASRW